MRNVGRVVVLLAVFLGVGWLAEHSVMAHAAGRYGAYSAEVRLAGMMAGLFAGGAAVVVAGIAMVWRRGKLE